MALTKERVALHEAGHAWVAFRMGWEVTEIFVDESPDGQVKGHTAAHPPAFEDPRQEARQWLSYLAGGIVSEAIQLGHTGRHGVEQAIRQTSRDAQMMIPHLQVLEPRGDWSADLDTLADEVEAVLKAGWLDVLQIAKVAARDGVCHLRNATEASE